ncbi:NlpC/P60 family protein [Rhizobium sp. SSA_523]|uniref:C40 family peptidase n=1 Tax=Rhizobium sp. SSA_523 TaxID=2952477 RepID=UPI0020907F65|nr:NlpC/P60 family protein [Rhizobium sp. SSA_523]MCO5732772.1 NlpC/P60 family protein [Rhizobium sp. SSA_523]WKC23610.1 NlpC/P60 family protein [Rhizobium sp. SSA_523]
MSHDLDRRLNAYRPDLADHKLEGLVSATRYAEGEAAHICVPVAQLRPRPDAASNIDTQLLWGETVRVFDRQDGWAWVQAEIDSYVGYLPEAELQTPVEASHWITAARSFVYPEAELRRVPLQALSMGSRVRVVGEAETRGTRYAVLDTGGAIIAGHCRPIGTAPDKDYVRLAALFLETPYLWGGRSGFGIDCSGLVQLAAMMAGHAIPRDSDMQAGFGMDIGRADLRRGDLVFWKGHVAIMEDEATILHANGHTMTVAREPLDGAIVRIGWLYGQPTGYRRFLPHPLHADV